MSRLVRPPKRVERPSNGFLTPFVPGDDMRNAIQIIPVLASLALSMASVGVAYADEERSSRISDERVLRIDPDSMPSRPPPLIEIGPRFLGSGPIEAGIDSPTGEVERPQLVVFGTFRSALQSYDDGDARRSEWANRLDLFANLSLSYTNRILIGIRPLDRKGRFSGRVIDDPENPSGDGRWVNAFNSNITTAFFEGDLGELFPSLKRTGNLGQLGFSIGRQPLQFQDGMLINDSIDAVGVIRNNVLPHGGSNLQFTFLYGWNEVGANDNLEHEDARLFGLFTQADYPWSTLNVDVVYVRHIEDGVNGLFWGVSAVQRIRRLGTTFRILGSHADGEAAVGGSGLRPVDDGYLLFAQINYTPAWGENILYLDAFRGIRHFTSAARGPSAGGPLGNTGILFAAFGIGNFDGYGAALGSRADGSTGAAFGYQMFSHDTRRQFIVEVGGRDGSNGTPNARQYGVGLRLQQAMGRRVVARVDAFGVKREHSDAGWGLRLEFLTQF